MKDPLFVSNDRANTDNGAANKSMSLYVNLFQNDFLVFCHIPFLDTWFSGHAFRVIISG